MATGPIRLTVNEKQGLGEDDDLYSDLDEEDDLLSEEVEAN